MRLSKNNRNIYIKIIVLLTMLLILAGCGFKDIDKRLFVVGFGVDKVENTEDYRITLKLAVPTGGKESPQPEFTYIMQESENIADAVHLLKTEVDKELEFGHTKVIIFGKKILEEDLRTVSDFFLRRRDFQQISWMGIGEPSAEDVLKAEQSSEVPGSNSFFNIFSEVGTTSPSIVSTYLFDFRRKDLESGIDPILPVIKTNEEKKELVVNKSLIYGEKKNTLELNAEQSQEYNILAQDLEVLKLDVKIEEDDLAFTVFVNKVDVNYKLITTPNQTPMVKMDLQMEGSVEESKSKLSQSKIKQYNELASKEVKDRIEKLLHLFKENQLDPLGFGLRYEATHLHKAGKNRETEWKELYPNLEFEVSVDLTINSLGSIK